MRCILEKLEAVSSGIWGTPLLVSARIRNNTRQRRFASRILYKLFVELDCRTGISDNLSLSLICTSGNE